MDKQMCQVCYEHEAEYQCECCGRLVCQHCINAEFICDKCYDERQHSLADNHSIFG